MVQKRRIKGMIIYIAIGILAILSMYPMQKQVLETQLDQIPVTPGMSIEMLAVLSLINPLILLVIALIAGYFTADKVRLFSMMIHPTMTGFVELKKGLKPALIGGTIFGIIAILFDFIMRPFLPDVFSGPIQAPKLGSLVPEILYGGIVEELLMRFGFMSLIVFLLWKLFQKRRETPTKGIYVIAIIISALLFAFGHLPATMAITEMTAIVWIRMLFLNGAGGLLFGWLFWKYNLETAMVSHMMAHVAMDVVVLLLAVFIPH